MAPKSNDQNAKLIVFEDRMDTVMELQEAMEDCMRGKTSNLAGKLDAVLKKLDSGKEKENTPPLMADFPPLHKSGAAGTSNRSLLNQRYPEVNLWGTRGDNTESNAGLNIRAPKFDFPRFNDQNPRGWIKKGNKYFMFNRMSDYEKIITASMYMDDEAEYWYHDYIEGKENMMWLQFVELLTDHFSSVSEESIVAEFNKLKQTTTVAAYQRRFEELKSFMVP